MGIGIGMGEVGTLPIVCDMADECYRCIWIKIGLSGKLDQKSAPRP